MPMIDLAVVAPAENINAEWMFVSNVNDKVNVENIKHKVEEWLKKLGYKDIKRKKLIAIIEEAWVTTRGVTGVEAAKLHGRDFVWPVNILQRDMLRLQQTGGYLPSCVQQVQAERLEKRLNTRRVIEQVPHDDVDFETIFELAHDGLRVDVSDNFKPTNKPPALRKLYKEVAGAVNMAVVKLWEKELVLLLPTSYVEESGLVLHYSAAHWATKFEAVGGRYILDTSDEKSGCALNTPSATERIKMHYGEIRHPTIDDFVSLILQAIDEWGGDKLIMFKGDLKGAFSLLNFAPGDAYKVACALTDGVTMIYHAGLFGWTGTPYGFDVVTRVLRRAMRRVIKGKLDIYVDDFFGVSQIDDVDADSTACEQCAEALLGPDAIAHDKSKKGRRLDVIGYTIDIDESVVTIRRANFLKVLCGFLGTDVGKPQPVKHIQRLASWSSRYSGILRHMRPFTAGLYAEVAGMHNVEVKKMLHWEAVRAVTMWSAMLVMMELDEKQFARSFDSFRVREPDTVICFDASLYGIGVSVRVMESGAERVIGVVGTEQLPFDLDSDSSYQNSMEFVAVVVGCYILVVKGYRGRRIKLVGDSVTALRWSERESFTGERVFSAALLYVLLGCQHDLWVCSTAHVAGVDNETHDRLSRGVSPVRLGFLSSDVVHVGPGTIGWDLLSLCNPSATVDSYVALSTFWQQCVKLCQRL